MSSLRQRPTSSLSAPNDTRGDSPNSSSQPSSSYSSSSSSSSLSRRALSQTLTSTANLANLLPTGTLLAFQLLTPIFTNNGACDSVTRPLTTILIILLAFSCFLACFTDTVKSSDGKVYSGLVTFKGIWLWDYYYPDIVDPAATEGRATLPDLRKYKVRLIDWVHGVLSVMVFVAVVMKDKNVVRCYYPSAEHETQEVLDIVPIGIGVICSLLFVVFPTTRHGIGYPLTPGPN